MRRLSNLFRLSLCLKIPLVNQERYTLFQIFPIPILDNRIGLYHVISTDLKHITRDDDFLMFIPMPKLESCKHNYFDDTLCFKKFAYPIDTNAVCEARILKSLQTLPRNSETSLLFAKSYNRKYMPNYNLRTVTNYCEL